MSSPLGVCVNEGGAALKGFFSIHHYFMNCALVSLRLGNEGKCTSRTCKLVYMTSAV